MHAPSPQGADHPLDLLVVGGGPGGTAAAFRAHELGLRTLVVDYDDLMKRIRDYSKDKLILPGFGGGDRMCFPRGGPLLESLCFGPIDKDDMCDTWKGYYAEHGVPVRLGVELTGMKRRDDGLWHIDCWDHRGRCAAPLLARHVAIAIGRGVPRRFDIPGDTDGIAYRLTDASRYVSRPACVIGGGTSAAEAVIAISNAKAAAGDQTSVYWSYRGNRMPRVSKALAEVFFEAYVGNGNIRYHPQSEPVSVITGDDRRDYLSIRVDRRTMASRPAETSHLEFPKENCIACIGEDIPERLLRTIGVEMATGGPRNKRRMVVNRYLETAQPNVYLVGDILSQAYFETDDFTADPAGFREVKHRGNIKSALRDGVLVAQVVHQRLAGKTEIDCTVEDVDDPAIQDAPSKVFTSPLHSGVAEPPAQSLDPERRAESSDAGGPRLVRILPGGLEENEYPLADQAVVTIGRQGCDLSFPDDTLLADRDASVSSTADGVYLRDDGSTAGVFVRVPVHRKVTVRDGDLLRVGRQFLLFSDRGGDQGFTHFDQKGQEIGRHALPNRTIVLGRQAPDVTLDPEDRTLSRRQLAISLQDGRIQVKDLKSVNGSYLRVRSAFRLEPGDRFRVGQQTFAFSADADTVLDGGHQTTIIQTADATTAPPPATRAAAPADGEPSVTFAGTGKTLPVLPGQTLCEVAEAAGISINAECHSGICGSDPVRIVRGQEHIATPLGDEESDTLEEICEVEPGPCRLACVLRINGPVEVEIL